MIVSFNLRWILFFLCLCSVCSPSIRFKLANEKTMAHVDEQVTDRIILINDRLVPNSDEFIRLLNEKKWAKFETQLKSVQDLNTVDFLHSIRFLLQGRYVNSIDKLNVLPPQLFDCQVAMLRTDCQYLLKRKDVSFADQYQNAFDCAENQLVKLIIKRRYRLVNYGY
jgi:hypothetical protein